MVKLFADDTSLYIVVDNADTSACLLNTDLEKIHKWSKQWLVSFNPTKTECLTISNKVKKPFHPSLIFNNVHLKEVETHKHLGIILSSNLSWNLHLDETVKKAHSRLGMLRRLKYILDRKSLQKLYFSFVRPVLEYADIIWDNIPEYLVNKIESIQLEAARIVTGGNRLASRHLLYKETGWEPLSKRRENHRLIQLHKIFHNMAPNYLSTIIQSQKTQGHNYNTRTTHPLREINTRTKLYFNSFFPATIRQWNALPKNVQSNPSLHFFKTYLYTSRIKIPNYFYFGTRIGQTLHSKLRLECSGLNLHLFQRKLINSPLRICGSLFWTLI